MNYNSSPTRGITTRQVNNGTIINDNISLFLNSPVNTLKIEEVYQKSRNIQTLESPAIASSLTKGRKDTKNYNSKIYTQSALYDSELVETHAHFISQQTNIRKTWTPQVAPKSFKTSKNHQVYNSLQQTNLVSRDQIKW